LSYLYLIKYDFILHYYLGKFIKKLDILFQRPDYGDSLCNNENIILIKPEILVVYTIEGLSFKGKEHSFLTDIHWYN